MTERDERRIQGCSICWAGAERDAAALGGPVLAYYWQRVDDEVDNGRTHFPPDDGFAVPSEAAR